jgi:hypothetical protein
MALGLPPLSDAVAGSATRAHAVDDDADEHESHANEDNQVRGKLRTGHASVVVIEGGVQMGDQICRDSKDHDGEPDL